MGGKFKKAVVSAGKSIWNVLPLIIGIILLISLLSGAVPVSFYESFFGSNVYLDSLIGALVGSVSAGTPITSYVIGGELARQGVSLIAVAAFLVAWVTVGVVQLPAEIDAFGKKFAIIRNVLSFILAILIGIVAVLILEAI